MPQSIVFPSDLVPLRCRDGADMIMIAYVSVSNCPLASHRYNAGMGSCAGASSVVRGEGVASSGIGVYFVALCLEK